jgi:hypothetical protein
MQKVLTQFPEQQFALLWHWKPFPWQGGMQTPRPQVPVQQSAEV